MRGKAYFAVGNGRRRRGARRCGMRLIVFLGLFFAVALVAGAKNLGNALFESDLQAELPAELQFDRLVIEKQARRLTAYAEGQAVREYHIALGWAPEGHKQVEGDGKTPEGVYFVDGKNPNSRYYKNLGVSYPNDADREAAAALGASPGGDIKIHGLPAGQGHLGGVHWMQDWTAGCIAVSNEEIDELYARTPVGAAIEIRP